MASSGLSIQVTMKPVTPDIFDDLRQAIYQSAHAHVVKSFLNDRFCLLSRIGELIRVEQDPTITDKIVLTIQKTERYFALVEALRTGDLEGLVENELLD